MTPLDLAEAIKDVRAEWPEWQLTANDVKRSLLLISERPDILAALIQRLGLEMTPSAEYAKRCRVPVEGNELYLGICQGKGIRAHEVTNFDLARAKNDYERIRDAEVARHIDKGIPLTGNIARPTEPVSADHPLVRPPWEQ